MNTEIYIEGYKLDVTKDISTLLNLAIDDVKDFSSRSTTWSKTVVLPGTANNNKLFGHIFNASQSNFYNSTLPNIGYNFNASKSASCIIFQDNLQVFKGVLRLMQINLFKGKIEYEAAVFGEIASLNVALSSSKLEDLDFSAYDHTYNKDAIINSWDNLPGSGYYYPLIDYGTYSVNKHDWDIRTFRPALYAKEYIDKIFAAAGFRYNSAFLNTARFKGFVIPHNQKRIVKQGNQLVNAHATSSYNLADADEFGATQPLPAAVLFDFFSGTDFTIDPGNTTITYTGTNTLSLHLKLRITGYYTGNANVPVTANVFSNSYYQEIEPGDFVIDIDDDVIISTGQSIDVSFNTGPTIYTVVIYTASIVLTSLATTIVNVNPGDDIELNYCIPKNIRQIDFLSSIVKLFNLYVYEDKLDSRLIHITPYIDFYSTNSSNSVDWTYKLNRDKAITVKPMSELNAKKYEFKYKSDSDYYNETYRKRYAIGYGDYVYDSQFEFAVQSKSFEIIFSATPLVGYVGEEKVYSTIFKRTGDDASPTEERIDSNIRILQSKKITGVTSWNIKDAASVLASSTAYGYAGHFDDPDVPDNDLNFSVTYELFFLLATGNLTKTSFNVFWSSYMAEITDKDSKLLTGRFYLSPKDMLEIDFSKYVHLDGVLYRINKISDYNASKPSDCKVELIKVNYLIY